MAQTKDRQQRRRGGPSAGPIRKKNCWFCRMKIEEVDWKDVNQLRRYVSEKGKIRSRRITGACRRHQRQVAVAVKRAREMALLPYVAEGREERGETRRERGDRERERDR
jgi:small subunit ribosomal protein S18